MNCTNCRKALARRPDGVLVSEEWGAACWANWSPGGPDGSPPPHVLDTNGWTPMDPKVTEGGDVGGDIQAGESWHLRFWDDALPNAIIDVHVYATAEIDYTDRPGTWPENAPGFGVQVQTEFCVCTDRAEPWDTEEFSDAVYDNLPLGVHTLRQADEAARTVAGEYAAGRLSVPAWDGQPWRGWENRPR